MTNKLLSKYAVDIFFISICLLLIITIVKKCNVLDIIYLCCTVYYYIRIKICRWINC